MALSLACFSRSSHLLCNAPSRNLRNSVGAIWLLLLDTEVAIRCPSSYRRHHQQRATQSLKQSRFFRPPSKPFSWVVTHFCRLSGWNQRNNTIIHCVRPPSGPTRSSKRARSAKLKVDKQKIFALPPMTQVSLPDHFWREIESWKRTTRTITQLTIPNYSFCRQSMLHQLLTHLCSPFCYWHEYLRSEVLQHCFYQQSSRDCASDTRALEGIAHNRATNWNTNSIRRPLAVNGSLSICIQISRYAYLIWTLTLGAKC